MQTRAFLSHAWCLIFVTALASQPAAAAVSADVLKAGITEEKLVHGEPTVTVNGTDVSIDSYRNPEETDNDLKIDAVLAAKKVFGVDKEVTRVTMRFRDLHNPAIYSEVTVTIGDVTAFGTGGISKEQLLSAMTVRRVAPESAIIVAPKHDQPEEKSSAAEAKPSTTGSAAHATASGAGRFSGYGLSFSYPNGWTASTPPGGNVQVRITLRGGAAKQPSMIDLRVYSSKQTQPATIANLPPKAIFSDIWGAAWLETLPDEMREKMQQLTSIKEIYNRQHPEVAAHNLATPWRGVTLAGVTLPATTAVGTARLPAIQKAFWATAAMSPRQYLRTVVCSTSQYVYQFNLAAPAADSGVANQALEAVLSAMNVKR